MKAANVEARFTEVYSDGVPAGKIILQTPNPGAKIASGQTVYVYVSKGVDPSKSSASLTEADLTIAGLTLGMIRQAVELVTCTGGSPTSRGIHVGSTLANVENAYGKNHS